RWPERKPRSRSPVPSIVSSECLRCALVTPTSRKAGDPSTDAGRARLKGVLGVTGWLGLAARELASRFDHDLRMVALNVMPAVLDTDMVREWKVRRNLILQARSQRTRSWRLVRRPTRTR